MGSTNIESARETTHLELLRAEEKENARNNEDRISLARRAGYSLMKSRFYGTNGVGPKVSYKIYQSYIVTRLRQGLMLWLFVGQPWFTCWILLRYSVLFTVGSLSLLYLFAISCFICFRR